MTAPLLLLRRRVATRPRRRILEVSSHWRLSGPVPLRQVLIRDHDGQERLAYLRDDHPALVAFLARAEVAA